MAAVAAPSQARVYSIDECVEIALESNVSLAKASESLTGREGRRAVELVGCASARLGKLSKGEHD